MNTGSMYSEQPTVNKKCRHSGAGRNPECTTNNGPIFYRTAAGAEIDLLLKLPGGHLWAVEIKRGLAPRPERGFHQARADLQPQRSFVAYSGEERYPLAPDVEAIGVRELAGLLAGLEEGHTAK